MNTNIAFIAGSNGGFGRILSKRLKEAGMSVHGVDLGGAPAEPNGLDTYRSESIATLSHESKTCLMAADVVLLCIPEGALHEAIPSVVRLASPRGVVVDVCSVKTPIEAIVLATKSESGYLSLHPMFPPVDDFRGRTIISVTMKSSSGAESFKSLMRTWGSTVTEMSALEHDSATAFVQALPHAALLAFGIALSRSRIPFAKLWLISTPIQKALLGALMRVVSRDQHVHIDLQLSNPHSMEARNRLSEGMRALSEILSSGDRMAALDLYEKLETMLNPIKPELLERAHLIVQSGHQPDARHPAVDDSRHLGIE